MSELKAPFPWFGGKRKVSGLVWERFGDVLNYVEPFAGSLAVLLGRPTAPRTETVNDKDAYLSNFWRAVAAEPEAVAYWADWPVNEVDLHARHLWLVNQHAFRERMMVEPDFYDVQIAGWWVWGLSAWIGGGWCAVEYGNKSGIKKAGHGTEQRRPALTNSNNYGVNAVKPRNHLSRPNLRPAWGVQRLPQLSGDRGIHAKRVSKQIPDLYTFRGGNQYHGAKDNDGLSQYMLALQARLRRVRVTCGDWTRIMGPSVTYKIGMTGIFLDPPYNAQAERAEGLYAVDDLQVSTQVREWCMEEIEDKVKDKLIYSGPRYRHPKLRIALCGYEDEHGPYMPDDWEMVAWKTNGGYSNQSKNGNNNKHKERIWFSPNCLKPAEIIRNWWVEDEVTDEMCEL